MRPVKMVRDFYSKNGHIFRKGYIRGKTIIRIKNNING
jgi:hypothetical protein